jgi:hypothetical protein
MAPRGFIAMSAAITDNDCDRFVDAFAASVGTIANA